MSTCAIVTLVGFLVYLAAVVLPICLSSSFKANNFKMNPVCAVKSTGRECKAGVLDTEDASLKKNSLPLKWSNLSIEEWGSFGAGICVPILLFLVLPAASKSGSGITTAVIGLLAAAALWYPTYNVTKAFTGVKRSEYNNISTTDFLNNQKNFSVGIVGGTALSLIVFCLLKISESTRNFTSYGDNCDKNASLGSGLCAVIAYSLLFNILVLIYIMKKPSVLSTTNKCCSMQNPSTQKELLGFVVPSVVVVVAVLGPLLYAIFDSPAAPANTTPGLVGADTDLFNFV